MLPRRELLPLYRIIEMTCRCGPVGSDIAGQVFETIGGAH
tara:strand:- start:3407 stop:3526 length:120 start_codon:yes stop_codon:yes gene_type:complete